MIPPNDVTREIVGYVDEVLAFLPWLPRPGVRQGEPSTASWFFYQWSVDERCPYIVVPVNWPANYERNRAIVRHEMGHMWADAIGRRRGNSYNIYSDIAIDQTNPLRGEIAAEVFARVMGEDPAPSYMQLEPLSRPTPERIQFVTYSGRLPDQTAADVMNARAIAQFWARTDFPDWFRAWANNYQTWLDIHVIEPLREKR